MKEFAYLRRLELQLPAGMTVADAAEELRKAAERLAELSSDGFYLNEISYKDGVLEVDMSLSPPR